MTDENNELILEIIDIFISQVEEIWNEMQDTYNRKDIDSLGKLAHKAKSSVAIMGMTALSNQLKDLELFCKGNTNEDIYQKIIDQFKSECLQAIDELQIFKKTHLMQKN